MVDIPKLLKISMIDNSEIESPRTHNSYNSPNNKSPE